MRYLCMFKMSGLWHILLFVDPVVLLLQFCGQFLPAPSTGGAGWLYNFWLSPWRLVHHIVSCESFCCTLESVGKLKTGEFACHASVRAEFVHVAWSAYGMPGLSKLEVAARFGQCGWCFVVRHCDLYSYAWLEYGIQ